MSSSRTAEIQRPPAPAALAQLKPRRPAPTAPAAIALPPARPRHHDDLSLVADPHILDHRPLQAQQPRPYPCAAHVVCAARSPTLNSGTLEPQRPRPLQALHLEPTETAGAPQKTAATSPRLTATRRMHDRG